MILRAENIMKMYGNRKVVKSISLQVEQGEIIGLLRPKWSWKNNLILYDRWDDQTK